MRTVHRFRHAASALTIGSLLSCGGPTEPRPVGAAYALVRVAGDALPALSFENEWVRTIAVADTLRFNADGTGTDVSVQRYRSLPAGAEQESRYEAAFTWVTDGSRVEVSYVCPINASCVAPPHLIGVLTGTGMRVSYALNDRVPRDYVVPEGQ